MTQLSIFGDSIMRGVYWDDSAGKYRVWQNAYPQRIEELTGITFKNHSQMGCTIERGRRLFDKAVSHGLSCDLLVLEYGGNDCDYDWGEIAAHPVGYHSPKTPLPLFEDVYRKFIVDARAKAMQPVLMTLPPIDALKYFNWFTKANDAAAIMRWLEDANAIYRHHELYSLSVAMIAKELDCPLIDLRGFFLSEHALGKLIGRDGLHPTTDGYQLIWEIISRFFKDKKFA